MRLTLTAASLAALVLAGCSAADDLDTSSSALATAPPAESADAGVGDVDALLASYDLAGLDGQELVETLDETALAERPEGLMASVRYDKVLVSAAGWSEPVPVGIEGDAFYLSVAPYVESTHECYFHSLTTCVGELGNEDVHVTVTDSATGEVLIDDSLTTFDNGFVGMWLPRDIDATLRVETGAGVAETAIGTGPEDPTCITTTQLS